MNEPLLSPQSKGESAPATPRWVKLFGLIALVFAVLFVLLHMAGISPRGHASQAHSRQEAP